MDNKQHYLDIAAGQGKKEPSRIVAFPAQPLNYALIEQRLEEQTEYTDGEISYLSDDLDEGFSIIANMAMMSSIFYLPATTIRRLSNTSYVCDR